MERRKGLPLRIAITRMLDLLLQTLVAKAHGITSTSRFGLAHLLPLGKVKKEL